LLAPRPTPKLEDHPLSAVRDCLFNIFSDTIHIGGRSSVRNPMTNYFPSVVTTVVDSEARLWPCQWWCRCEVRPSDKYGQQTISQLHYVVI